ncbi:ATP-binding protein [Angustibacter aerolatus]
MPERPGAPLAWAAVPPSAGATRRFVRDRLEGGLALLGAASDDVLDTVQLVVTELVTNVVLHAQTDLSLHLVLTGDAVRLAVADGSPHGPVSRPHTPTATTGRGWTVVTALTRAAGVAVVPDDGGKVVWCEIPLAERADQPPASSGTPGWVADEVAVVVGLAPLRPAATPPVTPPGAGEGPRPAEAAQAAQAAQATELSGLGRPVRLLGFPVARAMRLHEHRQALVRELELLDLAGTPWTPDERADVEAVRAQLLARYTGPVTRADAELERAARAGLAAVDLDYPPAADPDGFAAAWQRLTERMDDLSEAAHLLAVPTPLEAQELTDWVLAEYAAQGAGHPPTPWTGPVD